METQSSTPYRFTSFAAVQDTHRTLINENSARGDVTDARIVKFVEAAAKAGSYTNSDRQRAALQTFVDYWSAILQQRGETVASTKLVPFALEEAPELADSSCPFPGLRSYTARDAKNFFGRERFISEAVGKLRSDAGRRCLLITGESGSGKSSLLNAGILPRLAEGSQIQALVIDCRQDDLIGSLLGEKRALTRRELLKRLAKKNSLIEPKNSMVAVDHLGFFLRANVEDTKLRDLLDARLAELAESSTTLVLVLQTGAEGILAKYQQLQKILQDFRLNVPALTHSEIREVITGPAERVGLCFEDRLVDWLLHDTVGVPDALPSLACTLSLLWRSREKNQVLFKHYEAIQADGAQGVPAAIGFGAERAVEGLADADVRSTLLRMIRASDLDIETWVVAESDLSDQTGVVGRLADAGLLLRTNSPNATVTVAHSSLGRRWQRLARWLQRYRGFQEAWWRTEACRRAYLTSPESKALLLQGADLEDAEGLIEPNLEPPVPMSAKMREFILLSRRRQKYLRWRSIAGKAGMAAGALFLAVLVFSYVWWQWSIMESTDSIAGLARVASGWNWTGKLHLVGEAEVWKAYETTRPTDWYPDLETLPGAVSNRDYSAVLCVALAVNGTDKLVAFGTKERPASSNHRGRRGAIHVWWPEDDWAEVNPAAQPVGVQGDVRAIGVWGIGSDETTVAAGTATGQVILAKAKRKAWQQDSIKHAEHYLVPTESNEAPIFNGPVRSIGFSQDGQRLLASGPGKVAILDGAGKLLNQLSTTDSEDFVEAVFVGDSVFGAARDGRIYRWKTWNSNAPPDFVDVRIGPLTSLASIPYAYTPRGASQPRALLAVSGTGKEARICDAVSLELLDSVSAPSGAPVMRVQFGDGGQTLLLGTAGGVYVFDRARRDFREIVDPEVVTGFAAAGTDLVTASPTGRLKTWSSTGIEPLADEDTGLDRNLSTAIDVKGELIAIGGFAPSLNPAPTCSAEPFPCQQDALQLWKYQKGKLKQQGQTRDISGRKPGKGDGRPGGVYAVALSARSTLAAGNSSGEVHLWDLAGSPEIAGPGKLLVSHFSEPSPTPKIRRIWSLAFSTDGSELLAGDDCGNFEGFDVASGKSLFWGNQFEKSGECAYTRAVTGVQFSSPGLIATAAADSVRIWKRPAEVGPVTVEPPGHITVDGQVRSISWSNTSARLAIGCSDGTIDLVDLSGDVIPKVRACGSDHPPIGRDLQSVESVSLTGSRLWALSKGRVFLYGADQKREWLKSAIPGGTALAASESRIAIATFGRILLYPGSANSVTDDLVEKLRGSDQLPSRGLHPLLTDRAFSDTQDNAAKEIGNIESKMLELRSSAFQKDAKAQGLGEVLKALDQLNRDYPWKKVPAGDWNNLCWRVSIADRRDLDRRVLAACYAAVASDRNWEYRETLALALARRASNASELKEAVKEYMLAASAADYWDGSNGVLSDAFLEVIQDPATSWQKGLFNQRDFLENLRK